MFLAAFLGVVRVALKARVSSARDKTDGVGPQHIIKRYFRYELDFFYRFVLGHINHGVTMSPARCGLDPAL